MEVDSPINQSTLETNACSRPEARESMCEPAVKPQIVPRTANHSQIVQQTGTRDHEFSPRHFRSLSKSGNVKPKKMVCSIIY